jgi:ubiquitin carboxyl-terminal hydrolase 9/24
MIRTDLYMIYDNMMTRHRQEAYAFYDFWRGLALKLMSSQSLPLKLFGWDQAAFLIDTAQLHRPPAKKFHVSGAGCTFTNGEYQFQGQVSPDGYAIPQQSEISYVRKIPETEKDGGGKTLTLFRCTMRSQQKWWFLSEADEEQPGTDRDIDYYQHKSKEHEEREPPPDNWITCRNAGIDPPPTLRGEGLMVPPGEEYNTLEHQLARWATENGIVELVLGDSLHREIVARSTPLIKFLASMCERDDPIEGYEGSMKPNTYCLQDSHLLLAWKTCISKADAAVSTEVYQLLVTILPNLSSGMAVTLLSNVQMSLEASTEKRDFLPEVAEFCSALAASTPVDKTGQVLGLQGVSDNVRKHILHLMWTLLTHPDASSLKSYDNLKRYVANELKLEPSGAESRKFFLKSCTETLSKNSKRKPGNGVVDELHVLRAVKLTQFVLQACPREQTIAFVSERDGALPLLLFNELIAYMGRRNADLTMSPAQKRVSPCCCTPVSCTLSMICNLSYIILSYDD